MNEDVMAKIREYRKNLVITGFGFMAIELWDIIKIVIQIISEGGPKGIFGDTDIDEGLMVFFFYFFLIAFFAVITLFHTYIGLSAARYGTGKSRKKGFLVWAGMYAILTALQFPLLISDLITELNSEEARMADTMIASMLVELTLFFILFEMIYYAIRLTNIEKKYA
jgi:hypothetical protein